MQCPVCKTTLKQVETDCLICPQDDGVLLTGKHLRFKSEQLADMLPEETASTPGRQEVQPHVIICPHCFEHMQRTDYNDTGIIIEACPSCKYRWLDRGEYEKIISFIPRLSPEDRLFITDIDHRIRILSSPTESPSALLSNSLSADHALSARGRRGGLGFLSGVALQGLVKIALRYPAARFVAIVLILTIIAGFWFVQEYFEFILSSFR